MTAVVRTIADLRAHIAAWRRTGEMIGLVPTMGALHEGHLSLVRHMQAVCDHVVISIFVNPTQFGEGEDFDAYPRTETEDIAKLAEIGADLVFLPTAVEIYPEGFATGISVKGISDHLEGAHRAGHFDGVALVVTKLLLSCLPDRAIFGEKDYQQLQVIRRVVADLHIPVEIVAGSIAREPDGLALSSRNRYLDLAQRATAGHLNKIMFATAEALADSPADTAELLKVAENGLLRAGFDAVDYVALCDAASLTPLDIARPPARLLITARLGDTRLLDNCPVPLEPGVSAQPTLAPGQKA